MGIKVQGMEAFQTNLENLASGISKINNMALYEAAGIVAEEMRSALESLPTYDKWYGTDGHPIYGATPSEKAQIIENFGIADFRNTGDGSQTSLGFTGYVNTPSTRYNDKVPTGMLMQCINYGTQFRKGTHTLDRVEKNAKEKAIQAAQNKIDQEIKKLNI